MSRPPPSVASTSRTKPLQQPLAKRLLFPSLSADAPYPPLFSSPELTAEFYDFIALALRAYVSPWWSQISRYDKEFIPQVNSLLVHVIHVLESRLLNLDLPLLLFRDIPVILTQHYRDYRNASSKLSTSYANGGSYSLSHLFHQLQPHLAISPHGKLNQDYYRHIVDQILRLILPPEDYAADSERYIVREVILKVLLVDVLPRITQPWFIQLTILNLLASEGSQVGNYIPSSASASMAAPTSNSSQSFLILLLSTVQKLSGASLAIVHAYKQAVSTIKSVNQLPKPTPESQGQLHPHSHPESPTLASSGTRELPESVSGRSSPVEHSTSSPSITLPLLIFFSEAFGTAERLASQIIMTTLYLFTVLWTSFLDRLVPHLLTTCLSPPFFLNMTRAAKSTLFPNGYPGIPMEDPTPEEQAIIHAKLISIKPTGVLAYSMPIILGSDPKAILDYAIEPLADGTCNLHLAVIILDRIFVGLFPELVDPNGKLSQ